MTMPTLVVLLAAVACIPGAHARWECTMPNGRTVQREFGTCPEDAIEKRQTAPEPDTERPFVYIPKPIEPAKPEELPRKKPTQDRASSVVSQARGICAILRYYGATTCEVDINLLADSTIDATLSLMPTDAQALCLTVAEKTRLPSTVFTYYRNKGAYWWLKLHSSLGNGNRPIANCRL